MTVRTLVGDCRTILPTLAAGSFDCIVTSPPYFGLRDYGVAGQIGLEPTLDGYVEAMAGVARELWRVLKPSGSFWLNLGDCYAAGKTGRDDNGTADLVRRSAAYGTGTGDGCGPKSGRARKPTDGLKPKDLCLVPERVALRLQADGWWIRKRIIWAKPNPMPESVTDRPTSAHEHVWFLTRAERYFYDAAAIREPLAASSVERLAQPNLENQRGSSRANGGGKTNGPMKAVRFGGEKGQGEFGAAARRASGNEWIPGSGANARDVWTIASHPYKGAHFATMPPALVERCLLAGCPVGGHALDPFGGAGTTGLVADRLGRHATLIELNPAYVDLQQTRIRDDAPLLAEVSS